jgi:beta-1,2-mannobiose phosphorylase / 1,2-beta-oligomannan phosphorylase
MKKPFNKNKIIKDWKKQRGVMVEKLGIILKPTNQAFEKKAVLNPACYQSGEFVHVFYRAIDDNEESTIGYAKLEGPTKVIERKTSPLISRSYDYESKGVEDPRIAKFGKTYYMTYVAHDGKNALTAYATSPDLITWKKCGLISPLVSYHTAASLFSQERLKDRYFMFEAFYEEMAGKDVFIWFKDVFLFPKKIKGQFAMLIRILPDIQIVFFKNFKELKNRDFWRNYLKKLSSQVVLENKYWFESRNIGGGAPPVWTKDGWLVIFHTVEELNKARVYRTSAALLNKKNPLKVIGRLNIPLFSPEETWEKGCASNLECNNNKVVFPTGTAIFKKDLYIYYGASDAKIAVAKVNLNELLRKLKNTPQK